MPDKFFGSSGGFSGYLLNPSVWDGVLLSQLGQCKFILYTGLIQ